MEQTVSIETSNQPTKQETVVRVGNWRDYVSVTKVGITVSNLITVFAGIWLASKGTADAQLIFLTLLGTALVIAAGTTLNNYIDRDIDHLMERTANRPMPNGRISEKIVLFMGLGFAVIGLVLLASLTYMAAIWAMVGLFVYVIVYTAWLKRSHSLNTVVGAISGAAPVVIGYTAVTGSMDMTAWLLFIFMFLWQPPHFLALAMYRVDEYRKAGIPMLPVVRGFAETKRQMLRYVAAVIPVTILLYATTAVGKVYLIAAAVLGLGWLIISIQGLFTNDHYRWAKKSFRFSLIYMTTLFVLMIFNSY